MNKSTTASVFSFGSGIRLGRIDFMSFVFNNFSIEEFNNCMRHLIGLNEHYELYEKISRRFYEVE